MATNPSNSPPFLAERGSGNHRRVVRTVDMRWYLVQIVVNRGQRPQPQRRAGVPPAPAVKPTAGLSSRSRWRALGAGGTLALRWRIHIGPATVVVQLNRAASFGSSRRTPLRRSSARY